MPSCASGMTNSCQVPAGERTDEDRGLRDITAQRDDIQCLPAGGAAMDPELQALERVGGQGGVLQVQRLEGIGRHGDRTGARVYRRRARGVDGWPSSSCSSR